MTTPTWEPVGQEVLEEMAQAHIASSDYATVRVLLGKGKQFYCDDHVAVIRDLAAELLAARALLVALVDANDEDTPAGRQRWEAAAAAIRAHVAKLKGGQDG